jgi:hypothetical protein
MIFTSGEEIYVWVVNVAGHMAVRAHSLPSPPLPLTPLIVLSARCGLPHPPRVVRAVEERAQRLRDRVERVHVAHGRRGGRRAPHGHHPRVDDLRRARARAREDGGGGALPGHADATGLRVEAICKCTDSDEGMGVFCSSVVSESTGSGSRHQCALFHIVPSVHPLPTCTSSYR